MTNLELITVVALPSLAVIAQAVQAAASRRQAEGAMRQAEVTLRSAMEQTTAAVRTAQEAVAAQLYLARRAWLDEQVQTSANAVALLCAAAAAEATTDDDRKEVAKQNALLFFCLHYHRDSLGEARVWPEDTADLRSAIWGAADEVHKLILARKPVPKEKVIEMSSKFRLLCDRALNVRD